MMRTMANPLPPNVTKYRNRTHYYFFIQEDVELTICCDIGGYWWTGDKPDGDDRCHSFTDEEIEEIIEKYSLRDYVKVKRKKERTHG